MEGQEVPYLCEPLVKVITQRWSHSIYLELPHVNYRYLEWHSLCLRCRLMTLGCFPACHLLQVDVHLQAEVGFPFLSFPQISKAEKGCEGRPQSKVKKPQDSDFIFIKEGFRATHKDDSHQPGGSPLNQGTEKNPSASPNSSSRVGGQCPHLQRSAKETLAALWARALPALKLAITTKQRAKRSQWET